MLSEKALIQGIKKKEREALIELHDRFAPALLGICFRYCGVQADAEDVLHDALIKILSKVDTFIERPVGSFEGWMKRIVVNTALNFLREKAKSNRLIDQDSLSNLPEDKEPEPDLFESCAAALKKEDILKLICELPSGYRTVFNMYVFEAYSHKEIAEIMQCSENTSKTQLFKARTMLRHKLTELMNSKIVSRNEKGIPSVR